MLPLLSTVALALGSGSLGPGALASAAISNAAPAPDVTVAIAVTDDQAVQDLLAAYQTALATYERELAAAEGEERRELRKAHPAAAFWSRFETHGRAGSLPAIVWQIENVRRSGLGAKDRREFVPGAFRRLHADHVTSPDYARVVELAVENARALGEEKLRELFEQTLERNEHPDVLACTHFHFGMHLLKKKERARALEQLDICADRYATTEYGRRAQREAFAERNLKVGGTAPDFEGVTFEGETFRLSDHRGKVVVLDFFGFW